MANSNFLIAVPVLALDSFMQLVVISAEEEVQMQLVQQPEVNGRAEVWRLAARLGQRKISVSAYQTGSVCFQGLNPNKDCKLDVKILKRW